MSSRFEQAPPLPRHPTDLDVPSAIAQPAPPSPDPTTSLPPPPKFPSLSDVSLANAQAAAAANAAASQSTTTASADASTSASPHPEAGADADADADAVLPTPDAPTGQTAVSSPSSDQAALDEDIEAALRRDAVPPGTGARRVLEIGEAHWTDSDQVELDRLLQEGQQVFVPPDVTGSELPVPPLSGYSYIPVPPSDATVDSSPDKRTMADRIAVWNAVVPSESEPSVDRAVVLDPESQSHASPVASPREAFAPDAVEVGDTANTPEGKPAASADVARSIFGGKFLVKPVTSRKVEGDDDAKPLVGGDDPTTIEEVLLRIDSTAKVDITADHGLRGGHDSVVNDAAFMNGDKTLVTCGVDGKVCIWDMAQSTVQREFIPYDNSESVKMVYPLPGESEDVSNTLMTLSESRLMRIWVVDDHQAIMLRNWQITVSEGDTFMIIPVISKELRTRAVAAAAAAAVTTSDAPDYEVPTGTATGIETEPVSSEAAPTAPVSNTASATDPATEDMAKDEERDKKRFSLQKVLSFGRTNSRKAVAS